MENIPKKIYLQIGDEVKRTDKEVDFNDLRGVSWCAERIHKTDIVYYLKPRKLYPRRYKKQ